MTMRPLSGTSMLTLAVVTGVVTGVCEALVISVKRILLGQFVRVGPDIAWMAPVADAAIAVALVVVLLVCSRIWPRAASLPVVTFVLTFFVTLSLFLMYYPLHVLAKLAMAAGVATQAARFASRRSAWGARPMRRSLIAAVSFVVVTALALRLGAGVIYDRRVGHLPPAPANAPNVLLIVWDTVRAANLSLHGYERRTTPNLQEWAKSSVVFQHAMATSPWTLPSHGSMFTGAWPQELSANWETPLDNRQRTVAEVLSDRGYVSAGFVANTYYVGHELGLARGFTHYEDYVVSFPELIISSTLLRTIVNSMPVRNVTGYYDNVPRRSAAGITDSFLSWLGGHEGRPFFAFLNYFDAHESYLPPSPFLEAFGGIRPGGSPNLIQDTRRTLRRDWTSRPPSEIAAEVQRYDGAILYLDHELDRLLAALRSRGVLDNTLVIVTSDHGEQFGEHGLFLHGNSLYQPVLHVPLIMRLPGRVPEGAIVRSRVTLRDLPSTIVDVLSLPAPDVFPGASLARHWKPERGTRNQEPGTRNPDYAIAEVRQAHWALPDLRWYPAAKGDMVSVTDDLYHYIRNGDGTDELYSVVDDPQERQNLSGREEFRPILERLRASAGGVPGREQR